MSTDVARFEASERVDLEDFLFSVDESLRSNARHWGGAFLADPTKNRSWVLDGFEITNPVAAQVQVDLGRAVLAQREGGQVFYGALVSEGDAQRIVDVSTFSDGTYGVYVRFELIDGESSSRAFWNPQGTGSEIAQTIPTRRLANWSLRLELTSPGAEWHKLGEATVASGSVSGTTDQRDFFFEGEVHNSYQSGWSSEGGGIANDRYSNRADNGVKDLHTFTQAVRQCLEDVKGRGLRRWWSKGIGGMNVGFDDDPTEDRIALGDSGCYWDHASPGASSTPQFLFDTGDTFTYDRGSDEFVFRITTVARMNIDANGVKVPYGMVVGHAGTPVDDKLTVGDANFGLLFTASETFLYFDSNEGISLERSTDNLKFSPGGSLEAVLNPSGLRVSNGLRVGFSGNPVDDAIDIGDANFVLDFNSGNPQLIFDSDTGVSRILFTRASNKFDFDFDGVNKASLDAGALNLVAGLNVQADNYRWSGAGSRTLDVWYGHANVQAFTPGSLQVGSGLATFTGASNYMILPFIWPKGAVMTEWYVRIWENSGETCSVQLQGKDWDVNSATNIGTAETGSGGGGYQTLSKTGLTLSRADDAHYFFNISSSPGTSDVGVVGVEIKFRFDEPPVEYWSL